MRRRERAPEGGGERPKGSASVERVSYTIVDLKRLTDGNLRLHKNYNGTTERWKQVETEIGGNKGQVSEGAGVSTIWS